MALQLQGRRRSKSLLQKISELNFLMIIVVVLIASIGFGLLYSVSGGAVDPWAKKQVIRFVIGMAGMVVIALIDIRVWMFLAYPFYFLSLMLLVIVDIAGHTGMGATRWINLGFMNLQPSELMKIALVLALARYFHCLDNDQVGRYRRLVMPLFLIMAPIILVLRQPDLGTSILIAIGGVAILFAAGIRMWIFVVTGLASIPAAFGAWQFMKPYQQSRVLTFLNPERDPLGAGYHSIQAKIAVGSGGVHGKGFIQGSQSQLNFLPEKHTDFIFTVLAEEFGLIGGLGLLGLYLLLLGYAVIISMSVRSQFGRLLSLGMAVTFFLYMFINVAMNLGMLPVVGVPLPLVSYGGSAMLTLLVGIGFVLCVAIHRDTSISRGGAFA
ncbi:rod shape-determining protein RodA [Paremcibacter congregatus]|uniref:Peptidoglycan glycosyltransferase MrdB n=1 Tax=Paremcibacter congregatus TaxID=2043170 RepID=A0A2G4YTL9_9PROT|nr:rod shape-determining protein RodA [Paremcibacter congregatus]PHZ85678.1 rod shape-determining protein RodA [Paremcibacter congregatus]QDE26638.1 rod shape-determining protein RodA [Paremcibacter congregatus]|tara:strand:- start:1393 stop:2538 length:1146 start_codon:yes stop_codon:yes gene_type:complete